MLSRPFHTACHSTPYSVAGSLQVAVSFAPGVHFTQDILDRVRRPFQGLSAMGQWGGMAGERFPPQTSTLALINDGVPIGPSSFGWDFHVANVDEGTVFVIQNIVHHLHLFVAPVMRLEIRSPLVRDGSPVREDLPDDYEPYPFVVDDGRETALVTVDVDFVVRQAPAAAEPFRAAWDGWYEVAAHGGFCSEDYLPGEVSIYVEDDLKVQSDGIGGVFDDVVIDDAGFACLINMLQTLHHRLTPIAEVTIE